MNAVTLFSDDGCRQELTRSNLNRIAESIKSNRLSQTSLLMELGSFHSASGHTLSCLTPSAPSLEGFFSSSSLSFPGISMRGFCWILLPPPLPSPSPPPPPTGQELELIEAADQPRLSHKKSLDLGTDEHQLLQFPLSYPSNIPDNSDISDNSDFSDTSDPGTWNRRDNIPISDNFILIECTATASGRSPPADRVDRAGGARSENDPPRGVVGFIYRNKSFSSSSSSPSSSSSFCAGPDEVDARRKLHEMIISGRGAAATIPWSCSALSVGSSSKRWRRFKPREQEAKGEVEIIKSYIYLYIYKHINMIWKR